MRHCSGRARDLVVGQKQPARTGFILRHCSDDVQKGAMLLKTLPSAQSHLGHSPASKVELGTLVKVAMSFKHSLMRSYLAVFTIVLLFTCACEKQRVELVGFRVRLMPPCKTGRIHRTATDFMGNSVALELHSFREPTINGDALEARSWIELLKKIFSSRASKDFLIAPDPDVEMEQVLTVLDRLNNFTFVDTCVLLTPKQGKDISDDSCVME